MPTFPAQPVSAREFFEEVIPEAFAEMPWPEAAQASDMRLGVLLRGEGGGEWVFALRDGHLEVTSGSRSEAAFSLVQSVDDWRGALWEGRGGVIGKQASNLFRPGAIPEESAPKPALLESLGALDGLIELVVTGGEEGDWALGLKLGGGEVPSQASTTVSIRAEDAASMEAGELDPMQAFMTGRIEVSGDIALVMQLQLILMQAAAAES